MPTIAEMQKEGHVLQVGFGEFRGQTIQIHAILERTVVYSASDGERRLARQDQVEVNAEECTWIALRGWVERTAPAERGRARAAENRARASLGIQEESTDP